MPGTVDHPDSLKLIKKMREIAGPSGRLNYKQFVRLALYEEEYGYYRRQATRVGRGNATDFYTSQSLAPVFGALITDAIHRILEIQTRRSVDLGEWTLVEVGYESDPGLWQKGNCPFSKVVRIGPADPPDFSGRCVVFSNELFDAQPFHRIAFINGRWREFGVDVSTDILQEIILERLTPEVKALGNELPLDAPEGYQMDLPLETRPLLKTLTTLEWSGLFLALDYGKSWDQLRYDFPQGTARAYYKHKQSSKLIAQPGLQDLTCHICWDWLKEDLSKAGFQSPTLESQEAFFVKHAVQYIQTLVTANVGRFDPLRQSLMQLIHPATMGQQFQALWGYRPT